MKKVYIKKFAVYVPDTVMTAIEIGKETGIPEEVVREKLGIISKPVENNLSLSDLSMKSIEKLFGTKEESLKRLKYLVFAGSDFKDNYIWTMAPSLAARLGLTDSLSFDLSSQCVGSLVAIDMMKSKVQVENNRDALISIATKQSHIVNYGNKASSFMYDFSDGSGAVLISEEKGAYEILESAFLTDGSFSNIVFAPFGESYMSEPNMWSYKLTVSEENTWRKEMGDATLRNFVNVITDATTKSGYEIKDIDYLAFLHTKRSFHRVIMDTLGIEPNRSIFLDNYGHMQGVDPFLSLNLAEQNKLLKPGSVICLVSAGTGWTWGASVILKV
ncbi:MAG: hypothetical protein B2I18_02915 [Cuniculiplasma sp. C_DKE]|nr:MAG: hypothetical protein B2I18_02915 [Cuniculiplasma sp. C_DKE]